jgi:F-type H+-transporting ATPase subunit b
MKEDINVQREQLLVDAHQSAEAISKKNTESMQLARKTLEEVIARQTQEQVFAIARKTLRDLADTSLEERIIQAFSRQLQNMHGSTKKNLSDSLKKSSESVLVRSAFELHAEQQDAIRQSVKEISASDTPVRFEVAPNAIAGIELTSNGRRIAWSIDEYLISLQKSFSEVTNLDTKALEVNADLESERIL